MYMHNLNSWTMRSGYKCALKLWPNYCMRKVRQHQVLQNLITFAKLAMYLNIFVYDSMWRTNLPHILAVLTHCTYTIPLVGLEDLLKQHFPANRFMKAFNMSNKFDKPRINLIMQHLRSSEQVCIHLWYQTTKHVFFQTYIHLWFILVGP